MPRPVFADPKTDFIFKRIFGSEPHKHLLIGLLNVLLELEEGYLITDLSYLDREQRVPLPEMKLSIVDVKCVDQRGVRYVVEMQLFNVAGFEERVIYNASKAFTLQLRSAEDYRDLKGVIGVTICDFMLWPDTSREPSVPMLSRWHMQEQHTQVKGLPQIQYVFLELPKYKAGAHPTTLVDKWALFFKEAENLDVVPPELDCEPFREAFDIVRMAELTDDEYDFYEKTKMAEQDARGALELAAAEGREEGRAEGRAEGREEGERSALTAGIESLCDALSIPITEARQTELDRLSVSKLQELMRRLAVERRWPEL